MHFARIFLSHSSSDKELVHLVAAELAQRGVLSWLDIQELHAGATMSQVLARAIESQSLLALFLSPKAMSSAWVDEELATALRVEDEARAAGHARPVLPIFLGDPHHLVAKHPRLRARWLHADGDRVDRLGIVPDAALPRSQQAAHIATKIADRVYDFLKLARADELGVILDQRGKGQHRAEPPPLPENLANCDCPALVFRPEISARSDSAVLAGAAWDGFAAALGDSVERALGSRTAAPRKIRIAGASQLALPFLLGKQLNRTHGAYLFCYARDGVPLKLDLGAFDTPLAGGDAGCARLAPDLEGEQLTATAATRDLRPPRLTLLIFHSERYMRQARAWLRAEDPDAAIAWIPHPERIEHSEQVVALARDIKAFVDHVDGDHVELATSLPFHAMPLLGALLTPHVFRSATVLERVRGDHDTEACYLRARIP